MDDLNADEKTPSVNEELERMLRWRRRIGAQMEQCYDLRCCLEMEYGDNPHTADFVSAVNQLLDNLREWKQECDGQVTQLCPHRIVEDWVDLCTWEGHMRKIKYCEICETTFS